MTARWIVALGLLLLAGCGCGGQGDAIAMAQRLTPARLARLHADMAALNADSRRTSFSGTQIPATFADLHPQSVIVRFGMGDVLLAGCVDDKVALQVRGLEPTGVPEVWLAPGEGRGEGRLLWRGPKPAR